MNSQEGAGTLHNERSVYVADACGSNCHSICRPAVAPDAWCSHHPAIKAGVLPCQDAHQAGLASTIGTQHTNLSALQSSRHNIGRPAGTRDNPRALAHTLVRGRRTSGLLGAPSQGRQKCTHCSLKLHPNLNKHPMCSVAKEHARHSWERK